MYKKFVYKPMPCPHIRYFSPPEQTHISVNLMYIIITTSKEILNEFTVLLSV